MSDTDTQAPEDQAPATADTADTQTSEASTQSNQDAPEATQDQAQGATTEEKATDTAEEKLYAGKYKSAEEMEKAYLNLQSKATKDAMERANLTKALSEGMQPPAQADTGDDFQDEPTGSQESPDVPILKFILTHGDANGDAMQEVLKTDPYIGQIQSYDAKLEYAYQKSKNMSQGKAIEEAQKQAAQAAVAKVAEKQAAQVETPQATQATDENADLFRQATGNFDQTTRDKARLAFIRKNLV